MCLHLCSMRKKVLNSREEDDFCRWLYLSTQKNQMQLLSSTKSMITVYCRILVLLNLNFS